MLPDKKNSRPVLLPLILVALLAGSAMIVLCWGYLRPSVRKEAEIVGKYLRDANSNAVLQKKNIVLTIDLDTKTIGTGRRTRTIRSLRYVQTPLLGKITSGSVKLHASPSGFSEIVICGLEDASQNQTIMFNPARGTFALASEII
jgi:hypothetical protein